MSTAKYIIERSANGRDWVRVLDAVEYRTAKQAFPIAESIWKASSELHHTSASGSLREYKCDHVRIIRAGGTRAVHRFPPLRSVFERCP